MSPGGNFVGENFAPLEIPKAPSAIPPNDCNKKTRHAPDRESKIATHCHNMVPGLRFPRDRQIHASCARNGCLRRVRDRTWPFWFVGSAIDLGVLVIHAPNHLNYCNSRNHRGHALDKCSCVLFALPSEPLDLPCPYNRRWGCCNRPNPVPSVSHQLPSVTCDRGLSEADAEKFHCFRRCVQNHHHPPLIIGQWSVMGTCKAMCAGGHRGHWG